MNILNKPGRMAAIVLLCMLGAGCAVTVPDGPVAGETMTQAQMGKLSAQAEKDIASGNFDSARSAYVKVVTAYPKNATAWFRLGTLYLRTGQTAFAQQAFEQALRADPKLAKAHANLALAHLNQFRASATYAVGSDQVPEANRAALQSLLRDVDYALAPASTAPQAGGK
jgi:Tfp pilus assembly protein PilF